MRPTRGRDLGTMTKRNGTPPDKMELGTLKYASIGEPAKMFVERVIPKPVGVPAPWALQPGTGLPRMAGHRCAIMAS